MEQELSTEREENEHIYNTHKGSLSLKELCNLLISSFCSILEEFGLETQADEELLLLAIESNDLETVYEYIKLLRSKLSSVLLLKNINKEDTFSSINLEESNEYIQYIDNNSNDNLNATDISVHDYNVNELVKFNEDEQTNKLKSQISSIKRSPVPPLKVEFAGPGSWNRCQVPSEYPTD